MTEAEKKNATNNSQYNLFSNVQAGYYWSGTENLAFPGPITFGTQSGSQDISNNYDSQYYSWLVRSGDISAVPLPSADVLFLVSVFPALALGPIVEHFLMKSGITF